MKSLLLKIRYVLGDIGRRCRMLLFVPTCRYCGERQPIFTPALPQVLCKDCLLDWQAHTRRLCPVCAMPYFRCRCMPRLLSRANAVGLVKLAEYRKARYSSPSALVLRIKDVNDREAFRFLSSELTMPTFLALQDQGVAPESAVVSYAPRGRRAAVSAGHDQARMLARALAARLGCRCISLIERKRSFGQQKGMGLRARQANAKRIFSLKKRADVKGKTVVLVDDVCTTGATLAACTECLYRGGAERVLAVCVAQTSVHIATSAKRTKWKRKKK